MTNDGSPFDALCEVIGDDFPEIRRAREQAARVLDKLRAFARNGGAGDTATLNVVPPDGAVVLLGSLARREWTTGSDVDWTLLIDGQADPAHRDAATEFRRRLAEGNFREPGPTGVFGGLSFSHELIHYIGGEFDTNTNMTRRVLLLLESTSLAQVSAHLRVVRGILRRYLESERSFLSESGRKYKVPRFLLNDLVRYWRTVAVDYVTKQWERGDEGWALRNIKLRFSRKLLFVSGLLTCFACYLDTEAGAEPTLLKDEEAAQRAVLDHLAGLIARAPIDVLSAQLTRRAHPDTAKKILSAYDFFLSRLHDENAREHLKAIEIKRAYNDPLFNELAGHSHAFQDGLNAMLYDDDPQTKGLMLKYGVF